MNRRRFLSLAAAFACAPRFALADSWTGRAFGAEMSLTLHGPREETAPILADLPRWLDAFEQEFSLYRPNSALNRLNQSGYHAGSARFHALIDHVQDAHDLTGGLFDPTVQPLWQAYAQGKTPSPAQTRIGWHKTQRGAQAIELAHGQQLTLNGIAQGFATDLIRDHLRRRGFTRALVNLGEFATLGGPFRLGLQDPVSGLLGQRSLTDRAIATSSPGAMQLGQQSHILAPDGRPPLWSTVSIEADSATRADALSTAAVFMPRDALVRLKARASLHRVTVVDAEGNLGTL